MKNSTKFLRNASYITENGIKFSGTDQFFIAGLRKIMGKTRSFWTVDAPVSVLVKVITEKNVAESGIVSVEDDADEIIVFCSEELQRILRPFPEYKHALFIDISSSIAETHWLLTNHFRERGKEKSNSSFSVKRYNPDCQDRDLIMAVLDGCDIRRIAKEHNVSDRGLYSRYERICRKLDVKNRQEFFLKVSLLFSTGYWNKQDFVQC